MKHKVLLNGLLYAPDGTGISRYTEYLIKAYLSGGYAVDILMRDDYKSLYSQYHNVLFAGREIHSSGQRIMAEQWQLRKLYRQYGLVHFPDHATPILTKTATVATIHDLAMKTMSQQRTWQQNVVKNFFLQNTVHRAVGVICDSVFTRQELLRYYPQLEKKSQVIYLGIDLPAIQPMEQSALQKWNLQPGAYFLYVGTLAPHKNLVPLISAFSILCKQGYEGKLVLAGGRGWMYRGIFAEIERLKLQGKVIFTNYVTQQELETLYCFASCFISTSIYEGFGLPPLEAMIRGIPVIVSDIPVFHETVADCGLYCDPQNVGDIAQQMLAVLQNHELRKQFIEKGFGQVQQFSWQRAAKATWQFYQKLLNGR